MQGVQDVQGVREAKKEKEMPVVMRKRKDTQTMKQKSRKGRNVQVMPGRRMRVTKVTKSEEREKEVTKRGVRRGTQDTQMRALQRLHLWPHTRSLLVTRDERGDRKETGKRQGQETMDEKN